jgi:hypothetical protein
MRRSYKVAVVNQTFVRHFLRGRNPIGVHFAIGGGSHGLQWTIIGAAHDSESVNLRGHIEPSIYLPYAFGQDLHELTFYVRSKGDQRIIMQEIRTAIQKLDARVPVSALRDHDGTDRW